MREQYWKLYLNLKYNYYYCVHFLFYYNRLNWIVSSFLTIVSLSSVAALGVWKNHPLPWSALICSSQIIQALFPRLPYNDLLCSTRLMIGSLDKLVMDMSHSWLSFDLRKHSDDEIFLLYKEYEERYVDLTDTFYSGVFLPNNKYCHKKSYEEINAFFSDDF